MNELDEVIQEFLVESYENLDRLDNDLVDLERDPSRTELISGIFRTIHTIKGTCGFLGFTQLEAVTHVGENLLSRLRDGVLALTPEITSALLALGDTVRQMLVRIEATGEEGDFDHADLIAVLNRLLEPPAAEAPGPEPAAAEPAKPARGRKKPAPEPEPEPAAPEPAPEPEPEAAAPAPAPAPAAAGASPAAAADTTLRVDVHLLDSLMNLVGELVLTRNQILQHAIGEDSALNGMSQRLNLITTELQEGVMKTRMQPIGNLWSKLPRVVRDLAIATAKQVRLEMDGEDTELDKTIIEAIRDPLTHMVRNAVDHAIETPEERRAAGKGAQGTLTLRAFHEGGQVNIEIADDGGGINADKVKAKAVAKGLITTEQAARTSDRDAIDLIFLPGFSTRDEVTNLSGRGVGMDVVRTNIEKIGGTVEVQSQLGQGTSFKVRIPLTLAIIPALVVTSAGDRYAIPQVNLVELVRLEGEQARNGVELIHGAPVHRLRGRLLPLVELNQTLRVGPEDAGAERPEVVNIVVLAAEAQQFGLVVDGVLDTEEIVVKPLGKQLKGLNAFAGATIMGDGRVALILDVLGIAERSGVLASAVAQGLTDLTGGPAGAVGDRATLLVVGLGEARVAMPLATVARLEELPRASVERAGSQEVVQYRDGLLPLLRLGDLLGYLGDDGADPLQVVVHADAGRQVGLVVDHIHDIVDEALAVTSGATRPGITGSAVISGHVTDLLDLDAVIGAVDPTFFGAGARLEAAL